MLIRGSDRTKKIILKIYGGFWNVTTKEDVKHIIWTGTLTNERVLQSIIGGRKGVFVRQWQKKWLGHNAKWQFDA